MRLYTVKIGGEEKIAVGYKGEEGLYLQESFGLSFKDMNDLIETASDSQLELLGRRPGGLAAVSMKEVEILAPIPRPRQDVICLGVNYADHAEESAKFDAGTIIKERKYTVYFSKRVNESVPQGGNIPMYEGIVDSLDYEVELAVIIRRDAKGISAQSARQYIFGYTIVNDVSARNVQTRHSQWYLGKSLDGFMPMGPCIVTADEVGDASNLDLRCYVNGELRQNSNTKMLVKKIPEIVEELSAGMTLKAASIIATGTPAGVGFSFSPPKYLKEGDQIECRIQNIGSLFNRVVK
jgi:2-keto-4-pentenoate hydratase/2-oxohepta-3-ene-1,7-dioic acid hydratase in catechol pathway